jgi:hypothetical protein
MTDKAIEASARPMTPGYLAEVERAASEVGGTSLRVGPYGRLYAGDTLDLVEAVRTAQARIERLEAALREARSHFIVEYSDGKIVSTGHHSEALPKIVTILDAALKGETE